MTLRQKVCLLKKFIGTIPIVKEELQAWTKVAQQMPEPLRTQALLSLEHKAFHCVGGSVYAHYPDADHKILLPLIVSLQTISDYLDNLCDRLEVTDPRAFRVLHQSFLHALAPGAPLEDYYASYPYSEDVYLNTLVRTCQELLDCIPFYHLYQNEALRLASYYCELQVLKHVNPKGDELLQNWILQTFGSQLRWHEWAAATGSTLGIFLLFALGFQESSEQIEETLATYFPWIQGLHILLDYLIDLDEDEEFGDLNFTVFYPSPQSRDENLIIFTRQSYRQASRLPHAFFHETVVSGLIALYGSDPKVRQQQLHPIIRSMAPDRFTELMLQLCKLLRQLGYLP